MDTNEYLLVDFAILALYVNKTAKETYATGNVHSIRYQNGKYVELFELLKRKILLDTM